MRGGDNNDNDVGTEDRRLEGEKDDADDEEWNQGQICGHAAHARNKCLEREGGIDSQRELRQPNQMSVSRAKSVFICPRI